jgi:hypothetical protein
LGLAAADIESPKGPEIGNVIFGQAWLRTCTGRLLQIRQSVFGNGKPTWEVGCAGAERVVARGRTSDLKGAQVVTAGSVNGTSMTEVLLREGFKEHRFGAGGHNLAFLNLIDSI